MTMAPASLLAACLALWVSGVAPAQDSRPRRPDLGSFQRIMADATGLHRVDGRLVGGGSAYEVRFARRGVTFTPALGRAAPRDFPVTLRTVGFGRGSASLPVAEVEPRSRGLTALYERGVMTETYEVRTDGVEQSFVFASLPEGRGDLIVRVEVDTELELASAGDQGITFAGRYGGVTIGEVVGFDAAGARTRGTMRYQNGALELRLPARFVDDAVLPLVLDPLIGALIDVRSTPNDDRDPDIAYDLSNGVYLVVWEYWLSATNANVRGRFVSDGGVPGSTVFIDSNSTNDQNPRVANVGNEDAFCVVWVQADTGPDSIDGRAVAAATGAVGPRLLIAGSNDNYTSPDVGGEATSFDDDAIVVFENTTTDTILARQVTVDGGVSPPTLTRMTTTTVIGPPSSPPGAWNNYRPAISKSGGRTGNHMVVWGRSFSGSPRNKVVGAIISRNLTVLEDHIGVSGASNSLFDDDEPDVDGDGRRWVVAWERSEDPAGLLNDDDIVCRAVEWNPRGALGNQGANSTSVLIVDATPNVDEQNAAVAWIGGSALIAYEEEISVRFRAWVKTVDPFACVDCEGTRYSPFGGGPAHEQDVALASQFSGGHFAGDGALIAAEIADPAAGHGDVLAHRFLAEDGVVTDLGGGCGGTASGLPVAACAVTGNAAFASRLIDARASTTVWLVIGPDRLDLACGGCRLVPNPFTGFVIATSTDGDGDAEVATAIPSSSALVGVTVIEQWLIADPSTPSCATFVTDMSDAIEIEIQ